MPTLIGTTKDEMTLFTVLDLGIGEIDGDVVNTALAAPSASAAPRCGPAYDALYPDVDDADLLTVIATDRVFRIPAIRLAEAGLAHRPTHMYLFTWETPVFGGKLKSCHALELPFMWDAIDKPGLSMLTGEGAERQPLADAMHAAWIAFARTGDPGWPAYDPTAARPSASTPPSRPSRTPWARSASSGPASADPRGRRRRPWTRVIDRIRSAPRKESGYARLQWEHLQPWRVCSP